MALCLQTTAEMPPPHTIHALGQYMPNNHGTFGAGEQNQRQKPKESYQSRIQAMEVQAASAVLWGLIPSVAFGQNG